MQSLFNDQIIQALCWTLIHSLWQGLLLAFAGGMVIMLTSRSSSFLRYNLLAGLFLLFMVTSSLTFLRQINIAEKNHNVAATQSLPTEYQHATIISQTVADINAINNPSTNLLNRFANYFDQHASLVVAIWFILLSAQCIRLLANIGYIQRIRHYKTRAADDYWKIKMQELAAKMQIHKVVLLLESGIVKVPVMTGFLKPVILFPLGMLAQLPPEEVEAILMHELAHVKRKDYFVNLLQSFGEMLFFFNPGVRWISSLIRDERENCCDDLAIAETKDKKEFIQALVSFQEYTAPASVYTLAFPGRKNHLLNRVKRIISNKNKTLNNMEKISLASGMVIVAVAALAFGQAPKNPVVKSVNKVPVTLDAVTANDTVPGKKQKKEEGFSKKVIKSEVDGKEYELIEINDKITKLMVDGENIPVEKMADYKKVIDKIQADEKENAANLELQNEALQLQNKELERQTLQLNKEQLEMDRESLKMDNEDRIRDLKLEQEEVNARMDKWKNDLQEMMSRKSSKPSQEDLAELEKQKQDLFMQLDLLKARQNEMLNQLNLLHLKSFHQQDELLKKQQLELKLQQYVAPSDNLNTPPVPLDRAFNLAVPPLEPLQPITSEEIAPVPPVPFVKQSAEIAGIIDDLLSERIITDTDELSFTLNHKMLKVNGVQQSESMHARLREKYLRSVKDHVIYSTANGSTSADVSINRSGK